MTGEELEVMLEVLMEDLNDRAGTGGMSEEDEQAEVVPDGDD